MKRKIVKQGVGGRTIFLPIDWVRDNRLETGDEVEVEVDGGSLHISCEPRHIIKKADIELVGQLNRNLFRTVISSYYKAGYTELNIRSENLGKMVDINEIVSNFTGLEIISYTKDTLKIKSFVNIESDEVDNLIIKMFQMIKSMASEIDENWDRQDLERVTSVLDLNLRKVRDFTLRTIHVTRYGKDKSYDYYDLVTVIEKVGRELVEIARYVAHNKPKRNTCTGKMQSLINESYELFLERDFNRSNELWLKVGKEREFAVSHKSVVKKMKEIDPGFLLHYYHFLWLYRHISSRLLHICSV